MVTIKLEVLFFLNILYVTDGVRRITKGETVKSDKSYVVYLVKAPNSLKIYDEWLCGGALVSTLFIITSAACVVDVQFMYAVAGYNKYVADSEIELDECTKAKKKRVVYTCVPMKYQIDFHKVEKWSFIDIALVKVESAYDLNDQTFKTYCSYIPTVININFEQKFQKHGTDVLVYGWGHMEFWRKEEDNSNYNFVNMQYAASKIINKPECKKSYETVPNMGELIDQFMICTSNKGEFNSEGDFVMIDPSPKLVGCNNKQLLNSPVVLNGKIVPAPNISGTIDGPDSEVDDAICQDTLTDATRRRDENTNQTSSDSLQNKNRTVFNGTTTRKQGICQNDHGDPLVTWVGGEEILIGVASVFKVSEEFKCMGPYLYTSTQCNGAFLDCVLNNSSLTTRRAICDSPAVDRGYDTVEKYISWEHHSSGTADNETDANANNETQRRDFRSTQALQELLRFNMLAKMAKDQFKAIRQQRQRN